jgi:phosphoglycerate dehydrogenase-like enzyme
LSGPSTRLLLTETAASNFGADLLSVHENIELVVIERDGTLRLGDGSVLDREDTGIEVVWATQDLFGEGAPLRPFFGLVRRLDTLRWFQSQAAGFDEPVFRELIRRDIFFTTAHANSVSISDYVLRAVLDHYQDPARWVEAQAERRWARRDFQEVFATTWLVVGLGSIGAEVARRAAAFGAHVIGVRRHPTGDEPVAEILTPNTMGEAIGRADVVVLSAPAGASTHHLVDGAFLEAMKGTAIIVSVGRGSVVDEAALIKALDEGSIAAAVLDVFETEPLAKDHPLWGHPRVTVTPHNSAGGRSGYARAAEHFKENLSRYLRGEPLLHLVTVADLDD